jgi:hypothetical protein
MKATTTKNYSLLGTDFIKKKYMEALENIIADIRENTVQSIKTFISSPEEGKYQGMPESIIPPTESDIQTGFEHVKNHQPSLSSNHTILVIPYGCPFLIGETFSTEYFERELKPMPGKYFPGIVIALDPKHIKELEDVVHLGEKYLEKLWVGKDFGKRSEVQFMDKHNKISNEIPIVFAWWFAEKLAGEYLKWCKENLPAAKKEELAKCFAIDYCMLLTSSTISKSAADKSSRSTTKKRQRNSDSESDTDSYGHPASTSLILNASSGSPNEAQEDQPLSDSLGC